MYKLLILVIIPKTIEGNSHLSSNYIILAVINNLERM